MDIGCKMKNARLQAGITQQEAAQALGVSRQTISNWENEKTLPDIISVVRMSSLYDISLDHLLKEEAPVSDYLEYLEESTNVVRSQNKLAEVILAAVYLGIWGFSLTAFWLFSGGSDAMGYSLMYLWVLLPAATFIISLLIGKNNYWGKLKWAGAPVFGVMYMLAEYATFQAANMITFHKFHMPQIEMALGGAAVSLIGLGIGAGIHHFHPKAGTGA